VQDLVAYHLIPADVWDGADPAAPLRVASLHDEGFVHLTHRLTDLVDVANACYREDLRPYVVLAIRLDAISSPWRYDGDERFPHVYGPIDREAIIDVWPTKRTSDGTFLPIAAESDRLFDDAIDAAIERLPRAFAEQLDSVAIVVEDEPTADQLAVVRATGLFGLYQGVPRTRFGVDNVPIPSKITLFRGPLIRVHGGGDRLVAAIADTLYHEIAHHLGIDDDRLRELRLEGHRNG
jgi:predicted Zn-dependent protease with MMP-like domain